MSNTWHKTRWFHVGCQETEQNAPVDAASVTRSGDDSRPCRMSGLGEPEEPFHPISAHGTNILICALAEPYPHVLPSHSVSPTKGSPVTRVTHAVITPGSSAVSLTLKTAVIQLTTVLPNPMMPTPEPHCCKWGPGVSRQWGVRDLPGVPHCLYSFFLLEALGLVLRDWVFDMEVFPFDLKTQYWLEF